MRKLFAGLMATALIATAFVFPANAAYTATENFHVYINGGSVVSSKRAEKQLATALPMWAWVVEQEGSSVDWLPSEYVNIRGRSPSNQYATTVEQTNSTDEGQISLYYLDGYGQQGSFYKMAVQYDNNNPYTHLELTVTWSP